MYLELGLNVRMVMKFKAISMPRGFTLLELMVTLAIVAILATISVPSMRDSIQNSKAERATGLFELDLQFARSNAISRGEVVIISPLNNDIANGWQIVAETSGDTLRERGPLDSGVTITLANGGFQPVSFTPTGQVREERTIQIRIEHCTGNENKDIALMISGQMLMREVACGSED